MNLKDKKICIWGLGVHGGGLASALYCIQQGAQISICDIKSSDALSKTLNQLPHDILCITAATDEQTAQLLKSADIVIKNPAIKPSHPLLALCKHIETDISLFLLHYHYMRCNAPIIAITGSKGKSSVATIIMHLLQTHYPHCMLAGNITTSPLKNIALLSFNQPIILELSSFQLGDLNMCHSYRINPQLFTPFISIITNIYPDHQNYYANMTDYIADKCVIYAQQQKQHYTLLLYEQYQQYSYNFSCKSLATSAWISTQYLPKSIRHGAYITNNQIYIRTNNHEHVALESIASDWSLPLRINMTYALYVAHVCNIPTQDSESAARVFSGIAHRMELLYSAQTNIQIYNDSAATIPHATLSAVRSLSKPIHLLCGGTDKNVPLELFYDIAQHVHALYLLEGSASDRIMHILDAHHYTYYGPFSHIDKALHCIHSHVSSGDVILFSPGCASFGMFAHEFARGDAFRTAAYALWP